ncbi:sensor histidine kinase [Pleomorphomonas carboxyditropha]|uniref:sensor histidine kinase n=1 Tax=Pleomorphomonas carboxyditropha TaxID=2023338 RepID=UPI001054FA0C|nr:HWE histidine kinase domain-containing protein [Pleomorphomonas carboxyditropha]
MQPDDLETVETLARVITVAACASVSAGLVTYLVRMRHRNGGLVGTSALLCVFVLALAIGTIGQMLSESTGGGIFILVEMVTAVIAFVVGIAVWPMIPRLIGQPTRQEANEANALLMEGQEANRKLIAQLSDLNRDLESRVAWRTAELETVRHRFEVALEGSDISVLELDADLVFTWVHNPPEPLTEDDILGRQPAELLLPAEAAEFMNIGRRVLAGSKAERFEISLTLGGRQRWFEGFIEPLRTDGSVGGILAAAIDISRYKEHEREMRDILRELTHRSKNLLAVVQGIARQSVEGSPEAAAFLAPFGSRLLALSAAHELLVQNGWRGIPLDEVVTRAWADVEGTMAIRVEIDGPRVLLGPDVAQNVMLGAHELVAAAAAAEQPPERVLVSWALLPDGGFRLDWRMFGTSSIKVSGFGQRLLRTVLPVVLGGEVTTLGISDAGFAYGVRGRIGPQLHLIQRPA